MSPALEPRATVVFGGSFNPPHLAHLLAVATVLAVEEVERVLVVPTFRHPFAKTLAPYEDRVALCEAALAWLPRVEVSRVEEELGGESRTLRTLEHLTERHPELRLRLLLGADVLADAPKWHRFDRVVALAPPIVLGRHGFDAPGAPPPVLPAISSTEVRDLVARGDWEAVGARVPRAVVALIRERELYRS